MLGSVASTPGHRTLLGGLIAVTASLVPLCMLLSQRGTPLKRPGGSPQNLRQLSCAVAHLALQAFSDRCNALGSFVIHPLSNGATRVGRLQATDSVESRGGWPDVPVSGALSGPACSEFAPFLGVRTGTLGVLAGAIGHASLLGGIITALGLFSPPGVLFSDRCGPLELRGGSVEHR